MWLSRHCIGVPNRLRTTQLHWKCTDLADIIVIMSPFWHSSNGSNFYLGINCLMVKLDVIFINQHMIKFTWNKCFVRTTCSIRIINTTFKIIQCLVDHLVTRHSVLAWFDNCIWLIELSILYTIFNCLLSLFVLEVSECL